MVVRRVYIAFAALGSVASGRTVIGRLWVRMGMAMSSRANSFTVSSEYRTTTNDGS